LQDRTRVKAWLFTTLHRCFLQSRRRVTRFPHFEITEAEGELPNVEAEQAEHLEAHEVAELLAEVDSRYRAAVALFYLEDYSYKEIAAILEVPVGTVKSRIARGLAQLKALVLRTAAPAPGPKEGIA
jgi:RNA polymerase sigma-70 factor, ECF subfamily